MHTPTLKHKRGRLLQLLALIIALTLTPSVVFAGENDDKRKLIKELGIELPDAKATAADPAVEILYVSSATDREVVDAYCIEHVKREVDVYVDTPVQETARHERGGAGGLPIIGGGAGGLPIGELVGGAAGGLIGSQFGKGDGKVASAAGAAIIGTMIGGNLTRDRDPDHRVDRTTARYERTVQRRVVEDEVTVPCTKTVSRAGYLVRYRINAAVKEQFVPVHAPHRKQHR